MSHKADPLPRATVAAGSSEGATAGSSPGGADAAAAASSAADEVERHPFFRYYAQLPHQQNMLQDSVRTSAYRNAIFSNTADFAGRVVLDVGTGSGILAVFAAKAGARRVYAVEASAVAHCARRLVETNGLADVIKVIHGRVEDVELEEPVDIIVSEPMGFFLVHERMLESFVLARQRFLAPSGRMFPTVGTMFIAPVTDDALYAEQLAKAAFWQQQDFYGLDLRALHDKAVEDHFSQPVVGYFPMDSIIGGPAARHTIDFATTSLEAMQSFDIAFRWRISRTALLHGIGCWFDVDFRGSAATVKLSTAPNQPGTHWYQCRCLLHRPLGVNVGQSVSGTMRLRANKHHSFDISFEARIDGTDISSKGAVGLQDQYYHYLSAPYSGAAGSSATGY